jgi:hypothetical protein
MPPGWHRTWPEAGVGHPGEEKEQDVDGLDCSQRGLRDVDVPGVDAEQDGEPRASTTGAWPGQRSDEKCRRSEDRGDAASPGTRLHLALPPATGPLSRCLFRLAQFRCSWRIPIQVISGPSSRNAPFGFTCPDHRMRVPATTGSNISVYSMSA